MHRPFRLSLGPLEKEILTVLWHKSEATARDIHEFLLVDPDRELSYSSVTTVLGRLLHKGWVACNETGRAFRWYPLLTQAEAQALDAEERLASFLAVSTPEVMATLADRLDETSVEQLQTLWERVQQAKTQRGPCT